MRTRRMKSCPPVERSDLCDFESIDARLTHRGRWPGNRHASFDGALESKDVLAYD